MSLDLLDWLVRAMDGASSGTMVDAASREGPGTVLRGGDAAALG